MSGQNLVHDRISELESLLSVTERKADILTNLLKEANAEFEEALALVTRNEKNFRAVFENAPEAIYIVDPDSLQILDCNPFAEKWLGYCREDLVTMQADGIVESGVNLVDTIQRAFREGQVRSQEWVYITKDGTPVDAEVTGTLIEYGEKQCLAVLVRDVTERKQASNLLQKARDDLEMRVAERTSELASANEELIHEITDRKATEQALRQSEERYRTLVESSFDGIFVQRAGKIAFANTRLAEMLGYERGEIERSDHLTIYHPEDRPLIDDRATARLRSQPLPTQYEVRLQQKDGSALDVELNARVVTIEGDNAIQVCVRDITERKRLEEQLLQAQRLEGIGRLAGSVAHDFNNLLTAIIGYSDVLLTKTSLGDPFRDKILQINRAAERAAQLTGQLLAFSRKQVLEVKVLDLNHVILEFQQMLHRLVGEDIELFTCLCPDLEKCERIRAKSNRS